jgi:hypothetical protein
MKLITIHSNTSSDEGEDHFKVMLKDEEGKTLASVGFGRGEPEDFSLNRDLNDAFDIPKMIKIAYEAGKRGEELLHTDETYEDWQ